MLTVFARTARESNMFYNSNANYVEINCPFCFCEIHFAFERYMEIFFKPEKLSLSGGFQSIICAHCISCEKVA